MHVFNSLAPVFALIALGVILKRTRFVDDAFVRGGNKLVYWVGLPALLFHKIAEADVQLGSHLDAVGVFFGATLLTLMLAALVSRLSGQPGEIRGPFVQGAFRGNIAYVGLPVVVLSAPVPDGDTAVTAVLMLAVTVPFYNVLAVIVLESAKRQLDWSAVGPSIKSIVTNPLILACVAGGMANVLSKQVSGPLLPDALVNFLDLLGQMALPFALISIGATLRFGEIRADARTVLTSSLLKTIAGPAIGMLLCLLVPLDEAERMIVLVYLAVPTAAATFVMVDQIGGSKPVAAGIVLVTTVLSFPALFLVLWLYGV